MGVRLQLVRFKPVEDVNGETAYADAHFVVAENIGSAIGSSDYRQAWSCLIQGVYTLEIMYSITRNHDTRLRRKIDSKIDTEECSEGSPGGRIQLPQSMGGELDYRTGVLILSDDESCTRLVMRIAQPEDQLGNQPTETVPPPASPLAPFGLDSVVVSEGFRLLPHITFASTLASITLRTW